MCPLTVMVAGSWDETDPVVLHTAHEFGAWLGDNGHWLVTEGGTGIAEACAAGAAAVGGTTVEFHPSSRSAAHSGVEYSFTVFAEAGWDARSLLAVNSSDVLVVLGGQAGTLLEVVAAYQQSLPIVVVRRSGEMLARLEEFVLYGTTLDPRATGYLKFVDDIETCKVMVTAVAERHAGAAER